MSCLFLGFREQLSRVDWSIKKDHVIIAHDLWLVDMQKLFREWDSICPEKTILASNTSTLRIAHIMKVILF